MSVVLLAGGVLTMFLRPHRVPLWAGPLVAALVGVVTTVISWDTTRHSLDALRDPLLFLALAVPLAILLDRLGVFGALARRLDHGEHLLLWLWLLGIGVVVVFNLDAAVVLLTPLYIRIAQRRAIDPVVLAFQPALLACLASSPLPVSNLTNLIVDERLDLGVGAFLVHLGPMTVVACTAGWFGYAAWARRVRPPGQTAPMPADETADDGRALRLGLPIIGFVLVGFTVGNTRSAYRPGSSPRSPWRGRSPSPTLCRGARCRSGRCSWPRRSPCSSPGRSPTCTSTGSSTPTASPVDSGRSASGRSDRTRRTTCRPSWPDRRRCTGGPRCGRSWPVPTWPRSW